MYQEKKQTKQMIGGWRSSHADRLNAVIDKEAKEHGSAFTKGVLMDHLITLGLDAFEGNEKVVAKVKQEAKPKAKPKAKKFVKPTKRDVWDFFVENHNDSEAEGFYNYYESNGWRVGKNPMKDWKAAARNWMKNNFNKPTTKGRQQVDQSGFGDEPDFIDSHVINSQQGFLNHE